MPIEKTINLNLQALLIVATILIVAIALSGVDIVQTPSIFLYPLGAWLLGAAGQIIMLLQHHQSFYAKAKKLIIGSLIAIQITMALFCFQAMRYALQLSIQ